MNNNSSSTNQIGGATTSRHKPTTSPSTHLPIIGSQMNYSQTMPHLNYTQHDIREQYISVNVSPSVNSDLMGAAGKRSRGQSSDPRPKNSQLDDGGWNDNDEGDSSMAEGTSGAGTGASGHGSRSKNRNDDCKRARRSRSATSLFSSCFHISNLSQQIPARKLKIFSHFGLAPSTSNNNNSNNNNSNPSNPTLNEPKGLRQSKTMGHLQQFANDDTSANDENAWPASSGQRTRALGANNQGTPTQSSARKHVSFVSKQQQQLASDNITHQQQQDQMDSKLAQQQSHSKINMMQQHQQQPAAAGHGSSSSSSTVIMRNYQAYVRENDTNNYQQMASDQVSSMFGGQPPQFNQNVQQHPIRHQEYGGINQDDVITRQPTSRLINNNSTTDKMNKNMHPSTSFNTNHQLANQDLHHSELMTNKARPSTTGSFKRAAPIPMRTQATQTDITAYHLMLATPSSSATSTLQHRAPLSNSSSSMDNNKRQQQPRSQVVNSERDVSGASSSSLAGHICNSQTTTTTTEPAQLVGYERHSNFDGKMPTDSAGVLHNSNSAVANSTGQQQQPHDLTGCYELHERDQGAIRGRGETQIAHSLGLNPADSSYSGDSLHDLAAGRAQARSNSSPSSNSSSNSSLVGHDSALANRLGLVPSTSLHQPQHQHQRAEVAKSPSSCSSSTKSGAAAGSRKQAKHDNEQQATRKNNNNKTASKVVVVDVANKSKAYPSSNDDDDDGELAGADGLATSSLAKSGQHSVKNQQQQAMHSARHVNQAKITTTTTKPHETKNNGTKVSMIKSCDEKFVVRENQSATKIYQDNTNACLEQQQRNQASLELMKRGSSSANDSVSKQASASTDLEADDDYFGSLDPPSEFKDAFQQPATSSSSSSKFALCKQASSKDDQHQSRMQRLESQPSLSEASSQTDAPLAALNIENLRLVQQPEESSSSLVVVGSCKQDQEEEEDYIVINDADDATITTDRAWSPDETSDRATLGRAYKPLANDSSCSSTTTTSKLNDCQAIKTRLKSESSFHRTPSVSSSSTSASPTLSHSSAQNIQAFGDTNKQQQQQQSLIKSHETNSGLAGYPRAPVAGSSSSAAPPVAGSSGPVNQQQQLLDEPDEPDDLCELMPSTASQLARRSTLGDGTENRTGSPASSASTRRDEFLQLDQLELEAAGASVLQQTNNPAAPIQQQQQQQQVFIYNQPGSRKLSSTSTLSTRHHSYCSSDELGGPHSNPTTSSTSQILDHPDHVHHLLNEEIELIPRNDLIRPAPQTTTTMLNAALKVDHDDIDYNGPRDHYDDNSDIVGVGNSGSGSGGDNHATLPGHDNGSKDDAASLMRQESLEAPAKRGAVNELGRRENDQHQQPLDSARDSNPAGPDAGAAAGDWHRFPGPSQDDHDEDVVLAAAGDQKKRSQHDDSAPISSQATTKQTTANTKTFQGKPTLKAHELMAGDISGRKDSEAAAAVAMDPAANPPDLLEAAGLELTRTSEPGGGVANESLPTEANSTTQADDDQAIIMPSTLKPSSASPKSLAAEQTANQVARKHKSLGAECSQSLEAQSSSLDPGTAASVELQMTDKKKKKSSSTSSTDSSNNVSSCSASSSSSSNTSNTANSTSGSSSKATTFSANSHNVVHPNSTSQANNNNINNNSNDSPLTVSELDQDDEELSSRHSFLDSYKGRYEQVYLLADQVVGGALNESLHLKQNTIIPSSLAADVASSSSSSSAVAIEAAPLEPEMAEVEPEAVGAEPEATPMNLVQILDNSNDRHHEQPAKQRRSVGFSGKIAKHAHFGGSVDVEPSDLVVRVDVDQDEDQDQEDRASTGSGGGESASTSTSIDGGERDCCKHSSAKGPHQQLELEQQQHQKPSNLASQDEAASSSAQPVQLASRPVLPKKPAHLVAATSAASTQQQPLVLKANKQACHGGAGQEPEAAAAIAVTATTIAAAAQRHSNIHSLMGNSMNDEQGRRSISNQAEQQGASSERLPVQLDNDQQLTTRRESTKTNKLDGNKMSREIEPSSNSRENDDDDSNESQDSMSKQQAAKARRKSSADEIANNAAIHYDATPLATGATQSSHYGGARSNKRADSCTNNATQVASGSQMTRSSSTIGSPANKLAELESQSSKRTDDSQDNQTTSLPDARRLVDKSRGASLEPSDTSSDKSEPIVCSNSNNNHPIGKRSHELEPAGYISSSQQTNNGRHHDQNKKPVTRLRSLQDKELAAELSKPGSTSGSDGKLARTLTPTSGPPSPSCLEMHQQAPTTSRASNGSRSPVIVDCPYVHDLLVVSPNPSESPVQPAPSFQAHSARLSHDDTMEAIEDDVEGEELEQRLLQQQLHKQPESLTCASIRSQGSSLEAAAPPNDLPNTPLPPGFGGSVDSLAGPERALTPADSIKEEEEVDLEEDFEAPPPPELPTGASQEEQQNLASDNDDDDDEESSVSVSHRGVLVCDARATGSPAPPSARGELQPTSSGSVQSSGTTNHGDWSAKSMSNESATQAILDHLAMHHVGGDNGAHGNPPPSPPEIPAAGAATKDSSVDVAANDNVDNNVDQAAYGDSGTLTRRKSWRQRLNDSPTRQEGGDQSTIGDLEAEQLIASQLMNEPNTATMKRRRIKKSSSSAAASNQGSMVVVEGGSTVQAQHQATPLLMKNKLTTSESLETAQGSQEDLQLRQGSVVADEAQIINNERDRQVGGGDGRADEPSGFGGGDQRASSPANPTQASSQQSSSSGGRRGPPLGSLREPVAAASTSQLQQQPHNPVDTSPNNNNNNNYDSICSSCSCRDPPTEDSSQQQQPGARPRDLGSHDCDSPADRSGAPPSSSKQPATQGQQQQQQQQQQQWMSQEEGTVFTENYWLSHWLYISEQEESEIWRRAIDMSQQQQSQVGVAGGSQAAASEDMTAAEDIVRADNDEHLFEGLPKEMVEISSTGSEDNFNTKYKSTTRKMIHRRATIEMYRRLQEGRLAPEKRVEINRSNGEFGFRIHGSRPVVVSAIEKGTSAESCGLEVGDLIFALNGTNILDMAHSDVVRLAHNAQSSSLVLDLIPTNDFLRTSKYNRSINKCHEPSLTGFLMRLSPTTAQPLLVDLQKQLQLSSGVSTQQRVAKLTRVLRLAWRRRYFVLRNDNCLYWFKSMNDIEPHGGLNLQGFSATITNEFSEPAYVIRLIKYGGQPHYLGTNKREQIEQWIDAINKAATEANQNDPYMGRTLRLARLRPHQIDEPDCCGYLYKYSRKRDGGAHWKPIYFVLKDACLYLFRNGPQQAAAAGGQGSSLGTNDNGSHTDAGEGGSSSVVAASPSGQASAVVYLHGYRVRSKQIERKRHTFELIPPTRKTMRPIFLMASSEIEKKRWIAALEYTIDRWIEID